MDGPATTPEQRSILSHSIGEWTKPTRAHPEPYRNHYCANVNNPKIEALADAGLLHRGRTINDGTARYYSVTRLGFVALGIPWPKGWNDAV